MLFLKFQFMEKYATFQGSPGDAGVKNLPAMQETQVWALGQGQHLEEEMATHSSILAWEIPWIEEPGGLSPRGHKGVGHDLATKHK